MYNLLKPFGDDREKAFVGDMVNFLSLTEPEGPAREKELEEKLKICDILQADVDIQVDEALFQKAPNLKAVFCTSIGVDYVDLEAASKRNIIVANNPDFCVGAVAEYAIGLLYAITRRIPEGVQAVRDGRWEDRGQLGGTELFGKSLGIIGFGKTGREVARQALGIGMKVNVKINNPDPHNKAQQVRDMGATPMTMEEVLQNSDILTLHVPLAGETRNLIGEEQFRQMKEGAYLINVARGGVVDENALLANLENGKLAGAALDVLLEEPPSKENPLLRYQGNNLILTPHMAWYTQEAEDKNDQYFIEQVRDFVSGNTPKGIVNK